VAGIAARRIDRAIVRALSNTEMRAAAVGFGGKPLGPEMSRYEREQDVVSALAPPAHQVLAAD
jgi:hypothetical protein